MWYEGRRMKIALLQHACPPTRDPLSITADMIRTGTAIALLEGDGDQEEPEARRDSA